MSGPARPSRRALRGLLLVVVLALLLGACAGQRTIPDKYGDTTRNNFQEGCVDALAAEPGSDGFEDADIGGAPADSASQASDLCLCTYEAITADDGISFERFKEINDQFEEDPGPLPEELQTIISGCRSEVSPG